MSLFFLLPAGGKGITVNLNGEAISDTDGPTAEAGVRINTDGTVDKNVGGGYTQIDGATDWIIPNAFAGDKTYHFRATEVAHTGGVTRTGTMGSWTELTVAQEWDITDSSSGTWDIDIEVSEDAGATTLSTGRYEFTITIL